MRPPSRCQRTPQSGRMRPSRVSPADSGRWAPPPRTSPRRLPWLIRLDKYVDGQAHRGHDGVRRPFEQLVDRAQRGGRAGAARARPAWRPSRRSRRGFSVNGGDPALRLVIENPDDDWQADEFADDGALYKAESTGDCSTAATTPTRTTRSSTRRPARTTRTSRRSSSSCGSSTSRTTRRSPRSSPTGSTSMRSRRYLAMMDLLRQLRRHQRPGNNAYLHWDAATGRVHGRALGHQPRVRRAGRRGPLRRRWRRRLHAADGTQGPTGSPPSDAPAPDRDQLRPGGGRFGRANVLVTRFRENAAFEARYQEQLAALRQSMYESGVAQDILDARVAVLTEGATGLVDLETITAEAASVARLFTTQGDT